MRSRVKIYFDGGCRPLPIGMETAVVIQGRSYVRRGLGPGSGLEAEWRALIHAVQLAQELGIPNAIFLGDALGVIHQAQGTARMPAAARPYYIKLSAIAPSPADLPLRHVKRAQNLAGITLTGLYR